MKKKLILSFLAMTVAVGLAGCGGQNANTASQKEMENQNDSAKQAGGEKQDVLMWGSMSGDSVEYLNTMLEKYNASQEKYNVTYAVQDSMEQKLLTAIAGQEVPDIVMWDRFTTATYAAKGAFTPLDEMIAKDNVDMSQFYEPTVAEMTGADGTIYGLPFTVDARIIFYNKDLLAEAGVDASQIKTWDDLKKAAIAATKKDEKGNVTQAGFALSDPGLFNNWILQAGGKMIDTEKTPAVTAYNSEAGLAVLNYWNDFLNVEKVYELGFDDSYGGSGFKAGKVAMCFDGPWALAGLEESGINYGVIEQPEGPGGVKSAIMGGYGLVIPTGAKTPEAAFDFMKWWTTQPENGVEFTKLSGNLPANKNAAADPYFMDDEVLSVFSETMLYAQTRVQIPGYSDVEGLALRPQLELFVAGEISAEEALSKAQEQGDKILAEAAK